MASAATDLKGRKALVWSAFWKLERLWRGSQLTIAANKRVILHQLFDSFPLRLWILGVSLDMESKMNAFATCCYRIMLGIKRQDCISNNAIYSMTNTEPLVHYVRKRQPGFLGHILRLTDEGPERRYAFYVPPQRKRKPGRPNTSYITYT